MAAATWRPIVGFEAKAARAGFTRSGIQAALRGEYKHHGGYKWSYANG